MRERSWPGLVGRDPECTQLQQWLAEAVGRQSLLIRLHGSAGIGKTALLRSMVEPARQRGVRVVCGSGVQAEQDFVRGVLVSMFDSILSADQITTRLDPFERSDLAMALPSMRRSGAANDQSPDEAMLLICRAMRSAIRVFASGSPVLIVVDDLHWVDDASAQVLAYLVRHPLDTPLTIVTAARPGQSSWLDQVSSSPHVRTESLDIGPISNAAAEAMISSVPVAARSQIISAASGNPFYLKEFAIEYKRAGQVDGAAGNQPGPYPPSLRRAVLNEISGCSEAGQSLIETAAVLGNPFSIKLGLTVSEQSEETALAALDELLLADLVEPANQPGMFRFRHPLIAQVIYDDLPAGQRLKVHWAAVAALRKAGASVIEIARHLEASATAGDSEAIEALTQAANEIKHVSPRAAARLCESALQLIPATVTTTGQRSALIQLRAESLLLSGQLDSAMDGLLLEIDRGVDVHDERVELARVTVWLDIWIRATGRQSPPRSRELVETSYRWSVEALASGVMDYRLSLMKLLVDADAGRVAEIRKDIPGILQVGEALGATGPAFVMTTLWAVSEARFGDTGAALTIAAEAAERYNRLPADQAQDSSDGLLLLSAAEDYLGRSEQALEHSRLAMQWANRRQNTMMWIYASLTAQSSLQQLGRLDESADLAVLMQERAMILGVQPIFAPLLVCRAVTQALRQGKAEALATALEARVHTQLVADQNMRMSTILQTAFIWMLLDEPGRCAEQIAEIVEGDQLNDLGNLSQSMSLGLAAWSAADPERAQHWAARAASAVHDLVPMSLYWATWAQAVAEAAAGDTSQAVTTMLAAGEIARSNSRPVHTGLCLQWAGGQLIGLGDHTQAGTVLAQAHTVFAGVGAITRADAVATSLRRIGQRVKPDISAEGYGMLSLLSRREREIADLVASGLTSPEVAQQLFLSVRTVESHLRRIFLKLNITDRAQLAAIVALEAAARSQRGSS